MLLFLKFTISILLWFTLGGATLNALNFGDKLTKKSNKKREEMNEVMTIAILMFTAPLFVVMPLFV